MRDRRTRRPCHRNPRPRRQADRRQLARSGPRSAKAAKIKTLLQAEGLWSQYLEVGIGADAEVFTKAQPMAAVGYGASVVLHPISKWNKPEPEVVLVVNSKGQISRDPADLVAQTRGRITNIPTDLCCIAARCSRRCKTATGWGRALPTV